MPVLSSRLPPVSRHLYGQSIHRDLDREFRNSNDKLSVRFFFQNFQSDVPFGAGGLQASLGGSISSGDLNFPYLLPVKDRVFSLPRLTFSPRAW